MSNLSRKKVSLHDMRANRSPKALLYLIFPEGLSYLACASRLGQTIVIRVVEGVVVRKCTTKHKPLPGETGETSRRQGWDGGVAFHVI